MKQLPQKLEHGYDDSGSSKDDIIRAVNQLIDYLTLSEETYIPSCLREVPSECHFESGMVWFDCKKCGYRSDYRSLHKCKPSEEQSKQESEDWIDKAFERYYRNETEYAGEDMEQYDKKVFRYAIEEYMPKQELIPLDDVNELAIKIWNQCFDQNYFNLEECKNILSKYGVQQKKFTRKNIKKFCRIDRAGISIDANSYIKYDTICAFLKENGLLAD